jgi:hypothetical protein
MPSQTCYARAKLALSIGRERFAALVADAISSRLVAGPWRVHRQRLDRRSVADPQSIATGQGAAALSGDDPGDLLAMLPELSRSATDLTIVFAGFNLSSRKVASELRRYHYGDCPVVFLSLKVPTTVDVHEIVGDDEHPAYGDPWDDDEDEEDDDEDETDDDEGDDELAVDDDGRDELSIQDAAVFPANGPDFADLDGKSLLLGFLGKHFGLLLVGETHEIPR